VKALYAVVLVALLGFGASTFGRQSGSHIEWLDDWTTNGIQLAAAALCLWRGIQSGRKHLPWLLLGVGLLAWAVGDVYWTAAFSHGPPPGPSLADVGYLVFYPFAFTAFALLIRDRRTRLSAAQWWDGVVVGLGAAALCAVVGFGTIGKVDSQSTFIVAVNLAYPVGDLLLLAMAAATITLMRDELDHRWTMLGLGVVAFVVADTWYLIAIAHDSYDVGTPLDLLWPAAIVALSSAAWMRRGRERLRPQDQCRLVLSAPLAAAAGTIVVLVYATAHSINNVAVGLAAATLVAAGIRLAIGIRDLQSLAENRRLALTDDLTGLGNRRMLIRQLEALLDSNDSTGRLPLPLAVILVDLDRFKEVNDAFGHPVGDELLTQLGPRLQRLLRSNDVLARLGGDEFAVVLAGADSDYAIAIADRLAVALNQPFVLSEVTVNTGVSVGIALAPEHGVTTTGLLRCADVAMYRAKARHGGVAVYDVTADDSLDRFTLLQELREAIDGQRLTVHYQPQVDLRTGQVRSVEALARWDHPTRGQIPPEAFIPLAEEARLMRPLTKLILDRAMSQAASWAAQSAPVSVAVNLSADNLLDIGLPGQVAALLRRHGLDPALLVLEITESTLLTDPDAARDVIARLHELGVRLSIDDFGTGFSSLAYLRELPVDELKLDRTFVTGLGATTRARDAAIANSAVALGHALGLDVVAEGVEDPSTLAVLTELGFDAAQGYFLGRPHAAEDVDLKPRAIVAS
jgi:diguanylate cyclase (GGDEF)-like protein